MTNYTAEEIISLLEKNVLVLDGAMGTRIQTLQLREEDFRGAAFSSHEKRLSGFNDILCLSRPDIIENIHLQYIKAGADIITTNSFNANSFSMGEYGLDEIPGLVHEINRRGAELAVKASSQLPSLQGRRAIVAGSVGPTGKTASMSPVVSDPAFRDVDFNSLRDCFAQQIRGLIDGGVDIILFETVFDTLNLKAGLDAARLVMEETCRRIPVMISATIADKTGRTLSGQTLKAFVTTVENFDNVISIGLNCSFGPAEILPHLRELASYSEKFVSCHPNAGLPNALGEYEESPVKFAIHINKILEQRLVNIIGGCCGTTPEHMAAIAKLARNASPHIVAHKEPALRISGLDVTVLDKHQPFVNVGERCNVAGSRRFLRLIKEKKYEEAMQIAAKQVADGAMVIDINMDDALLDGSDEMELFIRYIASDPDIARVPVMVDSSDWTTVRKALKNLQGKSIVNSISLKEGETRFIEKAKRIRQLGAAVIVMAFDEKGQADTYTRKIEICKRAYDLLINRCGYNPEDIIFDVNVMAVATGMDEHRRYGIDFIEAVRWVKQNLPGVRTSGGISNLSFAFRGKNALREAMHAVFLYHAIEAGLDMGIVNAASTVTYDDIDPELRSLIEDVILDRREGAADQLADYASQLSRNSDADAKTNENQRDLTIPPQNRLLHAIIRGRNEFITEDLDEILNDGLTPTEIIEGPLMKAMNHVGNLFGEGKMFLPQVVKAARTMKLAVDHLRPLMILSQSQNETTSAGTVLFATVKGDVHDIGKNIASIVMSCNNFKVIDLGVMVTPEEIVASAQKENPDVICLSGLITPSLTEMANTARALREAGIDVPLLVGGAATSELHTALKIAPEYDGPVIRMADASRNPIVASRLLNPEESEAFRRKNSLEQEKMRFDFISPPLPSLKECRDRRFKSRFDTDSIVKPATEIGEIIQLSLPLEEIIPFINWKMFFHTWRLSGSFIETFPWDGCNHCREQWLAGMNPSEKEKATEAFQLYSEARDALKRLMNDPELDASALLVFHKANSQGDDLRIGGVTLPMLRSQRDGECLSLSDFVAPAPITDYVGVFAVTAGNRIARIAESFRQENDSYKSLLYQSIADRIAEAATEWLHAKVRKSFWGYAPDEQLTVSEILEGKYHGIRPAVGYPAIPDQLLNLELARLIPLESIGVTTTENGAMSPSATISGLMISNPDAHYFLIGQIGEDQAEDYARRRNLSAEKIYELLPKNISQPKEKGKRI